MQSLSDITDSTILTITTSLTELGESAFLDIPSQPSLMPYRNRDIGGTIDLNQQQSLNELFTWSQIEEYILMHAEALTGIINCEYSFNTEDETSSRDADYRKDLVCIVQKLFEMLDIPNPIDTPSLHTSLALRELLISMGYEGAKGSLQGDGVGAWNEEVREFVQRLVARALGG